MTQPEFEWDERKNQANKRKHGISFEEAKTVFSDERAQLIHDPDHSDEEDPFILLGFSAMMQTLVVCHCYREGSDRIRIISARKASRLESATYLKGWQR